MTLSVSIIVLNGEPLIRRCVESVSWADEIIVVDSGSTDSTREICRELGAQVTQTADF
ncbi:MAG TPA: glycosyltransferase, partial [Burkholderiales bacterium]|nr:glycosyltransferase [Burkholderiales bacterium]